MPFFAPASIAMLQMVSRSYTVSADTPGPVNSIDRYSAPSTPILPMDATVTAYYLRLQVTDQAGVMARIAGILAEHAISIDALLQRPNDGSTSAAGAAAHTDVIILTHDTVEGNMNRAILQMQALPTVLAPIVRIRKEELT